MKNGTAIKYQLIPFKSERKKVTRVDENQRNEKPSPPCILKIEKKK